MFDLIYKNGTVFICLMLVGVLIGIILMTVAVMANDFSHAYPIMIVGALVLCLTLGYGTVSATILNNKNAKATKALISCKAGEITVDELQVITDEIYNLK